MIAAAMLFINAVTYIMFITLVNVPDSPITRHCLTIISTINATVRKGSTSWNYATWT
jgi:hypothetical protein